MRLHVAPARPGLKVPDLVHDDFLPPEGREVPWSTYWQRRIDKGDVIAREVPAIATPIERPVPRRKPEAKEKS